MNLKVSFTRPAGCLDQNADIQILYRAIKILSLTTETMSKRDFIIYNMYNSPGFLNS